MNKEETKRKLENLMYQENIIKIDIRLTVWHYFHPDELMPESFPYKKIIREEFGLVA